MRLAVTGVSGYIGTMLCRRLQMDYAVRSIRGLTRCADPWQARRDGVDVLCGDVRDRTTLDRLVKGVDVVVHAAARVGRGDWPEFVSTNVDAVRQLSLAAARAGVTRVVLLSSIEVYGFIRGDMDEAVTPRLCGHPYADSKLLGETALWSALQESDTEGVVIRPGMVFGPESKFWTLRLIRLVASCGLQIYGKGNGNAMPIYIDDMIDGLLLCITSPHAAGKTFNLANVEDVTWSRWFSDYCAMVKRGTIYSKSIGVARAREAVRLFLGCSPSRHLEVMTRRGRILSRRATDVLGWAPCVGYEAGMRSTQEWLYAKGILNDDGSPQMEGLF